MLQRIYGTCWASKKELNDYLHRLEEAEKEIETPDEKIFAVKPMNCPGCVQIFNKNKSY